MTAAWAEVIVNLLDNAISFSPSGGRVAAVDAADRSRKRTLLIEDEGPGIPE